MIAKAWSEDTANEYERVKLFYIHLLLQVAEAFYEVCREVNTARRKNKTSLLDRVLGNKVTFGVVIRHLEHEQNFTVG